MTKYYYDLFSTVIKNRDEKEIVNKKMNIMKMIILILMIFLLLIFMLVEKIMK